jgi:FAD/FMN-containing dehydrogenase
LRIGRRSLKGVAGLDLTSLFVGSEGTLGFITEATMHLVPAPRGVETAWLSFSNPVAASQAAEAIFAAGLLPRMLELLDAPALAAVRPHSALRIPETVGACLLIEADGADESIAEQELVRMCEVATDAGALDAVIARSEGARESMRRTRRLVSSSLKERYPWKLSDDIAVPRSQMPKLLERAHAAAAAAGIAASAYGHLGDGNLHVNLLCSSAEARGVAQAVRRELLMFGVSLGGTISGEHGIGIGKKDMLHFEQSAEVITYQKQLKGVFDPAGILNIGKIWP